MLATLLVGCPVSRREWVLPAWLTAVTVSCARAGLEPAFVFVGDRSDPSFDVIGRHAPSSVVVEVTDLRAIDRRQWGPRRYQRMVELRNRLLGAVREMEPAQFLSLDSDILLHPDAVMSLLEALDSYDAVGARCYMTEWGVSAPSYGQLGRQGTLQRTDTCGLVPVDVIMAAKMMRPTAYKVDYRFDMQGEDIGWSKACAEAGLRLGWDGRVISKHVLNPSMLDRVDPRVGF